MISFGAVIHNEERHILGLLNNLRHYTDDIVLIDQASTDKTEELVMEWSKTWKGDINWIPETAKGYGDPDRTLLLRSGKYGWMFMIDADERIPLGIPLIHLSNMGYDAVNFPMRSLYFPPESGYENMSYGELMKNGKEVNEGYPDYHPRFLKHGTVWDDAVHTFPKFERIYNAKEWDMLHLKTYEAQLRKNVHYVRMFPQWQERLDAHTRYIQSQLGFPTIGLGGQDVTPYVK